MKKHLNTIVIVLLLTTSIILYKLNSVQNYQIKSLEQSTKLLDSTYQKNTKIWRDRFGQEHITNLQLTLEKQELSKYTKSIEKKLDIKPKQITDATISTNNVVINKPLKIDTIWKDSTHYEIELEYHDNYAHITGLVNGIDDSIHIFMSDSITQTNYWKRKWFLGEKTYYTDINNTNPYVHYTSIVSIKSNEHRPKIIIGPSITTSYNFTNQSIYIVPGVSILYYPFSLKF